MIFPEGFYKILLENINDGVYFTDKYRKILYWNKCAVELTGFSKREVLGRYCKDNLLRHIDDSGKELCTDSCPLDWAIKSGIPQEAEVYLHHKNGQRVPVSVYCAPIFNIKNEVIGAVEIFRDISYVKSLQERVKHLEEAVLLDELTRLSNRRFLELTISTKLLETKRYNRSYGVIFIDIDNFKFINDTYGHNVGDRVLLMVASTLRNNVRFYDTVGRWGGDEFVLVVELKTEEDLKNITFKINNLIQNSFIMIENEKVQATLSIGATIIYDNDSVASVVDRADKFMYESKRKGKNNITFG
ncbi:MAG: sensor domain-containing diguanylate cyclase [Proteobacteria bacterium]|nr:sensor domain-containing diguanylate cyclase [Pseudomonadota bacterium]